ncbi:MAG: tRNA uridine-5-carboxymethylaminomethyl(34) synthesis GTPase MnmE [Deltaproteobacteria bacterium]|nr:tRNA uridine-5-carboxymethylaminomethyl(34) synthesis GTPase MnmE [Deltaproteobacteria bacterium]
MREDDTIAAIVTPPGRGGVGIIRVSGSRAEEACRPLFIPSRPCRFFRSHHLYHGWIHSVRTGKRLDEVLFTVMRMPRSYTGEDTVEINCHGSPVILQTVLDELCEARVRLAEPGEFTRRAFLNGRLDLSQAEAVIDIITAKTTEGLSLALDQFSGSISSQTKDLRTLILGMMALLDGSIDFGDDESDLTINRCELLATADKAIEKIGCLLAHYRDGRLYHEGFSALITGRPNVGKSSLLNVLVGDDRSIVSPTPGTTRDVIEQPVAIDGLPVTFIDTAGIRESEDLVEREGVDRVWKKVRQADIVIIVIDGSQSLTEEDRRIIDRCGGKNILAVLNKGDLPRKVDEEEARKLLRQSDPLWISAKYGDGIDNLRKMIRRIVTGSTEREADCAIVTNLRHKQSLEKALCMVRSAKENIDAGKSPEFAALDMREALDSLEAIIGIATSEDVLSEIFSRFCIGK